MQTIIARVDSVVVAAVSGAIDQANSQELQDSLEESVEDQDRALVLDLQEVSYITSAGLRSILMTTKTLRARKIKLVLCAINNDISGVFRISGFEKIIPTYRSRKQAIAAMNQL